MVSFCVVLFGVLGYGGLWYYDGDVVMYGLVGCGDVRSGTVR